MKSPRMLRFVQILFVAFAFSSFTVLPTVHAAEKKETVKVFGNCGMCKKTIESSLKGADGVSSAVWNKQTKMLDVSFDESKTSLKKIEEKVAASGYDTQNVKASDATYNSLKKCCKYDRK